MTHARRSIAIVLACLVASGCSFSTSTDSSSGEETEVGGISQTRNSLPVAPEGFSLEADGEVWILTSLSGSQESEVVESDGVQLGSAMVTSRASEISSITRVDDDTIEILFECVNTSDEYLERIEYSYDGATLKVDSYITSSGATTGEPCSDDNGVSVQIPIQATWNPDAEVEQVAVR